MARRPEVLLLLLAATAPLSGQIKSVFDTGTLRNTSAIGQLGEMTGQTIRVPTMPSRATTSGLTKNVLSSAGGNNATGQLLGGMLGAIVLDALLSSATEGATADGPDAATIAAQQRAAAEQAQAELEARIANAARLRSEWDRRDNELSARLSGVFDLPRSTNFFGINSNANAKLIADALNDDLGLSDLPGMANFNATQGGGVPLDSATVDLSDVTTGVVPLLRAPSIAPRPRFASGAVSDYPVMRPAAPTPRVPAREWVAPNETVGWMVDTWWEEIEKIGAAPRLQVMHEMASRVPGYSFAMKMSHYYESVEKAKELTDLVLEPALDLEASALAGASDAAAQLGSATPGADMNDASWDRTQETALEMQKALRNHTRDEFSSAIGLTGNDYGAVLQDVPLEKSNVFGIQPGPHPDYVRMKPWLRLFRRN